jgi:hypothetical protein
MPKNAPEMPPERAPHARAKAVDFIDNRTGLSPWRACVAPMLDGMVFCLSC